MSLKQSLITSFFKRATKNDDNNTEVVSVSITDKGNQRSLNNHAVCQRLF